MRAVALGAVLVVLCAGNASAQSSVAASATVVGALEPRDAQVALRLGSGAIMIQAGSAGAARRGTVESVQVTRVSERGDAVTDVEGEAELAVDDAAEIRIIVTRVIASNS